VAAGLQAGLEDRGWTVDLLFRWPHPFQYRFRAPRTPAMALLSWAVGLGHHGGRLSWLRAATSFAARVCALPALALRYQAVIYVGADTLLRNGTDRALLHRLGVRTITVFCGSDARPPYLNGFWLEPDEGEADLEAIRAATERTSARVRRAERHSDYVVNHPATAQFHRAPYVDWTVMGMPGPPADTVRSKDAIQGPEGIVRLLHAPSDPRRKGTVEIRRAVEQLRQAGHQIDYAEVTGQPHAVIQELLSSSDIVVDELYSDALLAGLALEAARHGKPALVFGYAGDLVRSLAGRVGAPSRHYAAPDQLSAQLHRLVTDAPARRDLGAQLRAFVEVAWAPSSIAERYERLIAGDPDPTWFDAPDAYGYVHGWGVSEPALAAALARYRDRFGQDAFALPEGSTAALRLAEIAALANLDPRAT
jgi:hypothetical protein